MTIIVSALPIPFRFSMSVNLTSYRNTDQTQPDFEPPDQPQRLSNIDWDPVPCCWYLHQRCHCKQPQYKTHTSFQPVLYLLANIRNALAHLTRNVSEKYYSAEKPINPHSLSPCTGVPPLLHTMPSQPSFHWK